jgi:hypothetical protein
MGVPLTIGLIFRGPPYYEGTPTTTPWGAGQGADWSGYQLDSNFYALQQGLLTLAAAMPNGEIVDVFQDGNEFFLVLSNHEQIGPINLPTAVLAMEDLSDWSTSTPLAAGQVPTWTGSEWTNQAPVSGGVIISDPITLTASQIENLGTSPITIIEAPGAGYAISVIQTIYSFEFGTTEFSGSGSNAGLFYGGNETYPADTSDGNAPIEASSIVNSAPGIGIFGSVSIPPADMANQPIKYCNFGTEYSGGDGTMKITVLYAKVPV